jgi:hypothetical protein
MMFRMTITVAITLSAMAKASDWLPFDQQEFIRNYRAGLEKRLNIDSGSVLVRVSKKYGAVSESRREQDTREYDILWNKHQHRIYFSGRSIPLISQEYRFGDFFALNCPEYGLSTSTYVGSMHHGEIKEIEICPINPNLIGYNTRNPRLLGFVFLDYLDAVDSHESLIFTTDADSSAGVTIESRTDEHGRTLIRQIYKRIIDQKKCSIIYWKEADFSPIELMLEFNKESSNKEQYVQKITVEKHAESGLWFPVGFIAEKKQEKDHESIVASIQIRSLNSPIDPELFQLKSFGLKPGTIIKRILGSQFPSGTQYQIWDGKQIVTEAKVDAVMSSASNQPEPNAGPTVEPPPKEDDFTVYVLVGASILIAILILAFLLQRRRTPRVVK